GGGGASLRQREGEWSRGCRSRGRPLGGVDPHPCLAADHTGRREHGVRGGRSARLARGREMAGGVGEGRPASGCGAGSDGDGSGGRALRPSTMAPKRGAADAAQTGGPVTAAPPSIDVAGPSDDGGERSPSDRGGPEPTQPTAQAPDIPPPDPAYFAGMDEHTPEGAEQALRYYIAVSMWAHQTGNDAPLSELESGDCEGCTFLNEDVAQIQKSGLYWSEFAINDTGTAIHNSGKFEHEIGYVFSL